MVLGQLPRGRLPTWQLPRRKTAPQDKCPVLSLLLLLFLPPGSRPARSRPPGESSGGSRPRGSCPPGELSSGGVVLIVFYIALFPTEIKALQCIITPVIGFRINSALRVHFLHSLGSICLPVVIWQACACTHANSPQYRLHRCFCWSAIFKGFFFTPYEKHRYYYYCAVHACRALQLRFFISGNVVKQCL